MAPPALRLDPRFGHYVQPTAMEMGGGGEDRVSKALGNSRHACVYLSLAEIA